MKKDVNSVVSNDRDETNNRILLSDTNIRIAKHLLSNALVRSTFQKKGVKIEQPESTIQRVRSAHYQKKTPLANVIPSIRNHTVGMYEAKE